MRFLIFLPVFFLLSFMAKAQSETTQELHSKYNEEAFDLFFYKNTLQMINQNDDKDFAALINDIEKMKFLRLDKAKINFSREDVKALIGKYHAEEFEELMSMREENADIKILIKEKNEITSGLIMLINDQDNLAILDIKGSVPMSKIVSLYDKVKTLN